MIRVTHHDNVLHIETDIGGVSVPDGVLRSGNASFETRLLCYLADYLEKQTAAALVVDPSRLGAAMKAFDAAGGSSVSYAPAWMRKALEAASTPAAPVDGWDAQAYAQMADELESWKQRALTAEGDFNRLHETLNAESGPTFMGEPVLSTPAAPGIDLGQFRQAVEYWKLRWANNGDLLVEANRLLALIDASPKGGSDEAAWSAGYRAAMNAAAAGVQELYRNHVHHTGSDGLIARAMELEQSFIRDAAMQAQPTSHDAGVSE